MQCQCATSNIPISSAGCPGCGYGRCAYCTTTRVQVRASEPFQSDTSNTHKDLSELEVYNVSEIQGCGLDHPEPLIPRPFPRDRRCQRKRQHPSRKVPTQDGPASGKRGAPHYPQARDCYYKYVSKNRKGNFTTRTHADLFLSKSPTLLDC